MKARTKQTRGPQSLSHDEYPVAITRKAALEKWLSENGSSHEEYRVKFLENGILREKIAHYETEHRVTIDD